MFLSISALFRYRAFLRCTVLLEMGFLELSFILFFVSFCVDFCHVTSCLFCCSSACFVLAVEVEMDSGGRGLSVLLLVVASIGMGWLWVAVARC